MRIINNGGPAFPTDSESQVGDSVWHHVGMTLRDYFAAKAPCVPPDFEYIGGETDGYMRIVRWNYFYADAMIAEREK